MLQSLLLLSSIISIGQLAPAPLGPLDDLDFKTTYMQFFKIKDLIDKININRFEEFYGPVVPRTAPTPSEVTMEDNSEVVLEDNLPEIDLTEEAILNDEVMMKVPEDEVTTSAPELELTTVSLELEESTTTTTIAPTPTTASATTAAPTKLDGEETTQPTVDVEENEIDGELDSTFISVESKAAAKKYGYKILLKKVGGHEVPVGKIKFTIPTIIEVDDEDIMEGGSGDEAEELTTISPFREIIEEGKTEEEPAPITAVIPTLDNIDDSSLAQGVIKMAEEAEVAVMELKNQTSSEVIVFGDCAAPLSEVERMLVSLARTVAGQSDNLSQLLTLGNSIKDQREPETLARTGAEILRLVDPFLSSLVPPQVSSCAGSTSSSMLVSLSSMASQLDSLAGVQEDQDRAQSLHSTATSLQLAAWVISTLQHSVQTFYSQDGICGEETSSTAEILSSLSEAISGYIPIVSMLSNEASVEELERTVQALARAKEDIVVLESGTGSSLPGVPCGASFGEMAQALDRLADFVQVVQSNQV